MDLHRWLDAALSELPEKYRSTRRLRYYEDLEPSDIALRTNTPLETVRTRLKRGIALLRDRLDDRASERRVWVGALAASLAPDRGPRAADPVTLLVTGIAAFVLIWAGIAAIPAKTAPERVASANPRVVWFRAVDPRGAPIPGVDIGLRGVELAPRSVMRTTKEGYGGVPRGSLSTVLESRDPAWAAVMTTPVAPIAADPPVAYIVVAPARPCRGVVLSAAGSSIAGARIRVIVEPAARSRLVQLDPSALVTVETGGGTRRSFELLGVPDYEHVRLSVSHASYERAEVALDQTTVHLERRER